MNIRKYYIQDKCTQNVYHLNVPTYAFCRVNVWENLDDKFDMYLMMLLEFSLLFLLLEVILMELELCKGKIKMILFV